MDGLKVPAADEQVAAVLAADARRVRWLSSVVTLTLGAAVGLMAGVVFMAYTTYTPARRDERDYLQHLAQTKANAQEVSAEQFAVGRLLHLNGKLWFVHCFLAAGGAMIDLASYGAVMLVHASQKATLRQIQVSLAAISAQLAALGPAKPG